MVPRGVWLHAVTLGTAGLAFGLYTVVAQARGEETLGFLVGCIALLAVAQLQNRQHPSSRRTNLWEWVAATLTFVLVIGGWQLLDATDPSGPDGAPWSLRIVVVVAITIPLALIGWQSVRDTRR